MSVETGNRETVTPRAGHFFATGRILAGAAVASLVAAGLLLWSKTGPAVFGDMVLAAVAWCF